ncbi:carbohydrate ABC transporter membrane protein 1, CUT1 family [Nakamurella panacisegetis]|uniref:Carbohydrate ABC transporter membrane protein 1, CUT1 family n=1 Tax=Nakamurella panacisegetis TaxID=1090615 RepID=A0A1H0T1J2_9ACTN|nr:sugar ABC transporter permease [Nakamurella panacisegetis]SDP47456.1 carbohydrate ABC transporter membrane protein 1, CUT1 family [Nakamurella panacisegetis]
MSQSVQFRPPVAPSAALHRRLAAGRARSQTTVSAWMIAPAAVLLVTFVIVPIALTFTLAFTDAKLISPEPIRFIGFDNFSRLFADQTFWKSLRNTIVFGLVIVPVQAGLALCLALLINTKVRGVNFFRTVYFLPVVTSMVVVSILWTFMYQPNGLINSLLGKIGIHGPDWLGNTHTALAALIFMSIWQAVGFHMVIWLSGLQTISPSLYEASSLDGASSWQNFRFVTWPGLRQTRTFILITITISALSLFTQVNIMTQGGPLDSTSTVVYQAVRTGFQQQQTGYASAISLVFFILVLAVAMVQRFLTRDKDAR